MIGWRSGLDELEMIAIVEKPRKISWLIVI